MIFEAEVKGIRIPVLKAGCEPVSKTGIVIDVETTDFKGQFLVDTLDYKLPKLGGIITISVDWIAEK